MSKIELFVKSQVGDYQETKDGMFCTGRFSGCKKCFFEKYMSFTGMSVAVSVDFKQPKQDDDPIKKVLHARQRSKVVPIPFLGSLFEIVKYEKWSCQYGRLSETSAKKQGEDENCRGDVLVKTVKIYSDFPISMKPTDSQVDNYKRELINILRHNPNQPYQILHFCKFALSSAHSRESCLKKENMKINILHPAVSVKIRQLTLQGMSNIEEIRTKLTNFVRGNLLNRLKQDERPSNENSRYFPSIKVIRRNSTLSPLPIHMIKSPGDADPNHMCADFYPHFSTFLELYDRKWNPKPSSGKVGVVAVHLGAGYHSKKKFSIYKKICDKACKEAVKCLRDFQSAGVAAVAAVKILEDAGVTNAGFGSNLTVNGEVECEASIMDTSISQQTSCGYYGAVSGVGTIRNPITAAYELARQQQISPLLSLGRIPPCHLTSAGAEEWAREHGVEMCSRDDLKSASALENWEKYSKMIESNKARKRELENNDDNDIVGVKKAKVTNGATADDSDNNDNNARLDTVGVVVLDQFGKIAAATSTGGLMMKTPGRIGQSSTFGCGCWSESGYSGQPSIGVVSTGAGEQLIYSSLVKQCCEQLKTKEPYVAVHDVINEGLFKCPLLTHVEDKQAGLLTLTSTVQDGNEQTVEVVWGHTTRSMFVGHMSTEAGCVPKIVCSRLPSGAPPNSLNVEGGWIRVTKENSKKQAPGSAEEMDFCSSTTPTVIVIEQDEDEMSSSEDLPPESNTAEDKRVPDAAADQGVVALVEALEEHIHQSERDNHEKSQQQQMSQIDGHHDDDWSMDDDVIIDYIATDRCDGLSVDDCRVELGSQYNRKTLAEFEGKIELRWTERLKTNTRLFNGQKFRFDSVATDGDKNLVFKLGLTQYRDYVETNLSDDVTWLQKKGKEMLNNSQGYLAEPLAVGGVVVTADGKVIFQQRSAWVAESAGQLDLPGGHPEPSEAAGCNNLTTFVEMEDLDARKVIEEIFQSQIKEVRDEVNIPVEHLADIKLLGIVRNRVTGNRPVCYFKMTCSLNEGEIRELYNQGGAETDESTGLLFLSTQKVYTMEKDEVDTWKQLCPSGKAAVTLFSITHQLSMGKTPFQQV